MPLLPWRLSSLALLLLNWGKNAEKPLVILRLQTEKRGNSDGNKKQDINAQKQDIYAVYDRDVYPAAFGLRE